MTMKMREKIGEKIGGGGKEEEEVIFPLMLGWWKVD